jgi:hypothetical protein
MLTYGPAVQWPMRQWHRNHHGGNEDLAMLQTTLMLQVGLIRCKSGFVSYHVGPPTRMVVILKLRTGAGKSGIRESIPGFLERDLTGIDILNCYYLRRHSEGDI